MTNNTVPVTALNKILIETNKLNDGDDENSPELRLLTPSKSHKRLISFDYFFSPFLNSL